jgi:hypothetical protein
MAIRRNAMNAHRELQSDTKRVTYGKNVNLHAFVVGRRAFLKTIISKLRSFEVLIWARAKLCALLTF